MNATGFYHHKTVLLTESVDGCGDIKGKIVVDCTLGGGGHTRLLLERVGHKGQVIAFDRDLDALEHARRDFKEDIKNQRLILVDSPFGKIKQKLLELGVFGKIAAVLADIGVSSHQIDTRERGFSFAEDGPLDMRMDSRSGQSAADFLNEAEESEIADVIYHFGEEPKSRHIAKLITTARSSHKFTTTLQLSELIAKARLWPGHSKKHPATRTFQALRILVNGELDELRDLLVDGFSALAAGGRFCVISFHSIEDRLIKEKFNEYCGKSKATQLPREIPLTQAQVDHVKNVRARIIGNFPRSPSEDETSENPRARSAKLRVIEKITTL